MQTTRPPKKKFTPRHPLSWFINKIGAQLIKNNQFNIFSDCITVKSKEHAKALYADQDKGNRYK